MIASFNKARKIKNDVFYTPDDLVDDCMKLMDIIEDDDFLLDPFYGQGAFYKKYPESNPKDWCEIALGRDFFEYDTHVDWIISNPPFSKMTKVLNHCAKICRKGFGLIMTCFHLLPRRFNDLKTKGFIPTKCHLFKCRSWSGFPCFFLVFTKICDEVNANANGIMNIQPKQY